MFMYEGFIGAGLYACMDDWLNGIGIAGSTTHNKVIRVERIVYLLNMGAIVH